MEILWKNVTFFIFLHVFFLFGLSYHFVHAKTASIVHTWVFGYITSLLGTNAGAHRLWAHRSFKAKLPLKILLAFCQTVTLQKSIYDWVRDHQVHHKYVGTNADPHNASRGFFFSQIGWMMVRKHPEVIEKGKTVDLSYLRKDYIVMFQKKHYKILALVFSVAIPVLIPWYFYNESLWISWCLGFCTRYILSLHVTSMVNSIAHMWGWKPYDKYISSTENTILSVLALGEGWHNFHHVFPWDYKAGEWGNYGTNLTMAFIDAMAKIGWAYELKTVNPEAVKKQAVRAGDGSRKFENQKTGGDSSYSTKEEEAGRFAIILNSQNNLSYVKSI